MMRLQHIELHPLLKGYVEKMWVFESDATIPESDLNLIVPNGLIKLVVPVRNGLAAKMQGWEHVSQTHSLTLIGMTDIPSVVRSKEEGASCSIGIEFNPSGAYRFFQLPQSEIRNQVHSFADVANLSAKILEEQLSDTEDLIGKVQLLQQFLLKQLAKHSEDPIFEYCVQKIHASNGRIPVKQLEKETGYSARWLNMKFTDRVGISPKNLSSIVRFQQFYQSWANSSEKHFFTHNFYDYYYDQSHFIKDFKRFTGLAPTRFAMSENEFGKIFYKE